MTQLRPSIAQLATESAASIPDTIDLASPSGTPPTGSPADDPRPQIRLYRSLARFSPALSALLLLGIAMLAIRSWQDLSRWWGLPLFIAGVLGGLLALSMLPLQDMALNLLARQTPNLPASFEDVARGLLAAVFQTAGAWIGGESAMIGGGGLVLFVTGLFGSADRATPKPGAY